MSSCASSDLPLLNRACCKHCRRFYLRAPVCGLQDLFYWKILFHKFHRANCTADCGGPHARAASKWSRNKTALERVQNLYYCLFDRLQDTSFRVGYFQVSIQVGPCWLDFSTDCAGGLAIMYCLVVGQTLRTFKSLVTLRALVEPLLFIGASQILTATGKKPIVP